MSAKTVTNSTAITSTRKLCTKIFLMSGLSALFVAMSAAIAEESAPAVAATADPSSNALLVAKGKALYGTNCIHCHGPNMVTPGIVAYDLRQFPHDDKARFVNSVTNGKNGRMPPWGDILKREDIDALWDYVLTGGKS